MILLIFVKMTDFDDKLKKLNKDQLKVLLKKVNISRRIHKRFGK